MHVRSAATRSWVYPRPVLVALVMTAVWFGVAATDGDTDPAALVHFATLRQVTIDRLSPAGCVPLNVGAFQLPVNITGIDVVAVGERVLLQLMVSGFQHCGCGGGVGMSATALASLAATSEPTASLEGDAMDTRVRLVLGSAADVCVRPANSGRRYQVIDGAFTFEDAHVDATRRGGRVAIVASRADNALASSKIGDAAVGTAPADGNGGRFVWIGARGGSAGWFWESGEALAGFLNWASTPADLEKGTLRCAGVGVTAWGTGNAWQWAPLGCSDELPYLLEIDGGSSAASGGDPDGSGPGAATIALLVLLAGFIVTSVGLTVYGVLFVRRKPQDVGERKPPSRRRYAPARRGDATDQETIPVVSGESSGSEPPRRVRRAARRGSRPNDSPAASSTFSADGPSTSLADLHADELVEACV